MKRAGAVLFVLLIIITIVFFLHFLLSPVDRGNQRLIPVKIEQGTSSREIGRILNTRGLIRSEELFNIVIRLKGVQNQLKAGLYEFSTGDSLLKILAMLVEGEIATFQITIPEGATVDEIINRLSDKTIYAGQIYEQEARRRFDRSYLESLDRFVRYPVEGFLYPSTYIIPREYTPSQIFTVLLNEFEKRWLQRLNKEAERGQYNLIELVTIASMIEEEARLKEEKPLVSAVIYNRLERQMLLQIDASVQYVLSDRKERILYEDLRVNSFYNTYQYRGLPPGPIASPGDDSLEAALNPADVDYLFYFARDDGSHVFTRTYEEHLNRQRELQSSGR